MSDGDGDPGAEAAQSTPPAQEPTGEQTDKAEQADDAGDRPDESKRFAGQGGELDEAGQPGARRTAENTLRVFRDNFLFDRNTFNGQVGDSYTLVGAGTFPAIAGPVPADQLAAGQAVYSPIPAYAELRNTLLSTRLVALCGDVGTGRLSTALALLTGIADGNVVRLDRDADLARIGIDEFLEHHGYVAEPVAGVVVTELHLDRLSHLLEQRKAYGVVLVSDEDLADELQRGRYGRRCPPPESITLFQSHLSAELDDPERDLAGARALAEQAEVRTALGLDELRPQEARLLAGLVARAYDGRLDQPALLDECRMFAPRQVQAWFAGLSRHHQLPDAQPALRSAAFRIALAVYNGSAYSLVAEVAEDLAWRLAAVLDPDPEKEPGRPLFADYPTARLASARAVFGEGVEEIEDATVPVRTIRFQGESLATAVLDHVWARYPNVRPPVVSWLHALACDPRSTVFARAAMAAGLLTSWDPSYGLSRIVAPMAARDQPWPRLFAAMALDQAARDETATAAIRSLARASARSSEPALRWTAAAANAYGRVAGSVTRSLAEIARVGTTDNASLFEISGLAAVRLTGSADPGLVLDQIAVWLEDTRRERRDLGLLTAVRLAEAKARDVATEDWGGKTDAASAVSTESMPLPMALAEVHEQWGQKVAELVWTAWNTVRSKEAASAAVTSWFGAAATDRRSLDPVARFLVRLVDNESDRRRLRGLIERAVADPDDPLPTDVARALWKHVKRMELRQEGAA